jgi:hypothetical protein
MMVDPLPPVPDQPPVLLPDILKWPTWISLVVLLGIFLGLLHSHIPIYHTIMVLLVLPYVVRHHGRIAARLQPIPLPPLLRFILLGYLGVLAEEALVGTIAGLAQGGGLGHVARKIQQFQLFNLFAFTGLIIGLGLLRRLLATGRWDLWVIAGCWGLFAESVYVYVFQFPVAGVALVLPTLCVYAVIMAPAWLSMAPKERGVRRVPLYLRAPLAWAVMFVLSVAPIHALQTWRDARPDLFPDCSEIACSDEGQGN